MADMEAAASDSARPKRKLRWNQFGLRTLLIVVTLAACGLGSLGWQVRIAAERRAVLARMVEQSKIVEFGWDNAKIPPGGIAVPIRRWFGDNHFTALVLPNESSSDEIAKPRVLHPEANVRLAEL